jgi:hypothetical protein
MRSSARKRAEHPKRPPHPAPTSVTIAIRPSSGGGMRAYNHDFPKNGSRLFFAGGLDRPNQLETARQIRFFAHRFLREIPRFMPFENFVF